MNPRTWPEALVSACANRVRELFTMVWKVMDTDVLFEVPIASCFIATARLAGCDVRCRHRPGAPCLVARRDGTVASPLSAACPCTPLQAGERDRRETRFYRRFT